MKCHIGLGSNLGCRKENLEKAAIALQRLSANGKLLASPIYESRALLPAGAPAQWDLRYLNAVVEMEWSESPALLLVALKKIEIELGRIPAERWAPRLIDLDILAMGELAYRDDSLEVPHPRLRERSFALAPLKDLVPHLKFPGTNQTALQKARELPNNSPLWMGILNLTPDSFSDGGRLENEDAFLGQVIKFEEAGVHYLDIGGESTRPGARPLSAEEEWQRIRPALEILRERYRNKIFRPRISVDTRHAKNAEKSLELGADCLNDVSGLADPSFLPLLKHSGCEYVLMHSLSVPASKEITLTEHTDPIETMKSWAETKLHQLDRAGVPPEKVFFDPGLGFGKTAAQSTEILRRFREFHSLPARLMLGHSRKSFLARMSPANPAERDPESVGVSLHAALAGAEILRVHEPSFHIRAFRAFQELQP